MINNPTDVSIVLSDIAATESCNHSRTRVYPQDVSSAITLTANAAVNTFGNWVEIIPLNTIPFEYEIVGLIIEAVSAATTYLIQLGYSTTAAEPAANDEAGERRIRLVTVPISRATELLQVRSQDMPANAKLWGRVKTASTNADTCEVSITIGKHVEISTSVPEYGAFPW